jgi:hypothetical protein
MDTRMTKVSLYVRNRQTRKYELAKPKTYPNRKQKYALARSRGLPGVVQ